VKMFWHYTTNNHMAGILADGAIRTTAIGLLSRERPIAWFSADSQWERTAWKGLQAPDGSVIDLHCLEDFRTHNIRVFRIGVFEDAAPHSWSAIRRMSGIPPRVAKGLVQVAHNVGASEWDWRGSFEPVTEDQWQVVEEYTNGKWKTCGQRISQTEIVNPS
jgi:hypothetical protein